MSIEVAKNYQYIKNGTKITIKRKYQIKGTKNAKHEEVAEYFKNNLEHIKNSTCRLNDLLDEYNQEHEKKISYSMFYQNYKNILGFRKNHDKKKNKQAEEKTDIGNTEPETEDTKTLNDSIWL